MSLGPRHRRAGRAPGAARRGLPVLLVVTVALVGPACVAPSYAPISRVSVGTLPEALGPATHAVQVSGGYSWAGVTEVRYLMGLTRHLDWEFGQLVVFGRAAGWPGDGYGMTMFSGGLRASLAPSRRWRLGVAGGLALGFGGSAGVEVGDHTDEMPGGAGGGGYLGFDVGLALGRWVGLYLGNRFSLTGTMRVAATLWGYHVLGLQLDLGPRVYLSVETGFTYYVTAAGSLAYEDSRFGPTLVNATLGVRFPVSRRAR